MSDVEGQISKLSLKRGDIVVVSGEDWPAIDATMKGILGAKLVPPADEQGPYGVPIVRVPPGSKLEAVDEAQMNAAGWYRR